MHSSTLEFQADVTVEIEALEKELSALSLESQRNTKACLHLELQLIEVQRRRNDKLKLIQDLNQEQARLTL